MSAVGDQPGPLPVGSSRTALIEAVAAALEDVGRRARVVVALSGGPDSTALAYLVTEARPDLEVVLAHVRHGLRDDTLDREVVATHASWLGLPLEVLDVEVHRAGRGLADAARRARYGALRRLAERQDAEVVLVGHTAEDQAETVLQRLARGTGVDGLVAMRRRSGGLLRPLLHLRRADVHGFVLFEGLPSVQDPSNVDPDAGRARVRQEVLPALERIGPDPVAAMCRLAMLAGDDAAALQTWAERTATDVRRVGPVVAIAAGTLGAVPPAVARRGLRRLVVEVGGGPPPSAAVVARIAALDGGAALDLAGEVRASAAAGWITLAPTRLPGQEPTAVVMGASTAWGPAGLGIAWHGPATAVSAPASGQIAFELPGAWSPPEVAVDVSLPPGAHPERARLALPDGTRRLWLRHRRPGDRVRLAVGTRRLSDLLVDVGMPRPMRALWPVLVDADDQVVWVPGVAADEAVLRAGRRRPTALLALARLPAGRGQ